MPLGADSNVPQSSAAALEGQLINNSGLIGHWHILAQKALHAVFKFA